MHGVRFEDLSEQQRTEALNALNAMSTNPQPTPSPSPSPEASPGKKSKVARKKPAKPQNEIVIDLSGVGQKGYPAPVNLDEGRGK